MPMGIIGHIKRNNILGNPEKEEKQKIYLKQ